MLYAELLLFGACVGVISGMLGIGGGVVLVPGLMMLFHFSQQEAQGTSLAAFMLPIGVFAALVYWEHGYVKVPVAATVAVGLMAGAYVGARLVPYTPIEWLRLAFGGLLLYLGFLFAFGPYVPKRVAAALPVGLAAVLVATASWLRRKRLAKRARLPPPDAHTEYHI